MHKLDTDFLLQEWGAWLRVQTGMPRYVSPSFALLRDNVEQCSGVTPAISDDLAMLVDRLVARMGKRDPEMAQALWNYHRHAMNFRLLGRLMGVSHTKASQLVQAGRNWVDGALSLYCDAA